MSWKHMPVGAKHPLAKLDDRKVREIRALLTIGAFSLGKIARSYKVDTSTIRQIKEGVTWRHVI